MFSRKYLSQAGLSLILAGLLLAPQGVYPFAGERVVNKSNQYLAPTHFDAKSLLLGAIQMALISGIPRLMIQRLSRTTELERGKPHYTHLSYVRDMMVLVHEQGYQLEISKSVSNKLNVIFYSGKVSQGYWVSFNQQGILKNNRTSMGNLFVAFRKAVSNLGSSIISSFQTSLGKLKKAVLGVVGARVEGESDVPQEVVALYNDLSPASRRGFIVVSAKLLGGAAFSLGTGINLLGCQKPSGSTFIPGVSGNPVIVDTEKDFNRAVPTPLKDAATPDASVILLARIDNVDPNNVPLLFRVSAVTASGEIVVLNPFDPKEANRTFAVFPINDPNQEQVLAIRAYSKVGGAPINNNEVLTFKLEVLEGDDPFHPRIGPRSAETQITINQIESLIKRDGQPEPGELVKVEQNPLGLSNANDGTLRLTFKTNIKETDSIKPEYVFIAVFEQDSTQPNNKGRFLAQFFPSIIHSTGLNEFDIQLPDKDPEMNAINPGNIVIEAVNADVGLTPPPIDSNKNLKSFNFARDNNSIALNAPVLENNQVELVNGTRLLKLRINPNAGSNDPLKPEFHFVNFKLFDVGTNREFTYGATLGIPTALVNGVQTPLTSQANEYFVEIPEELFSPQIQQSVLQSVEIFNVRRGYQAESSGEISLISNNTFTNGAKLTSSPQIQNVTVQDTLVNLEIDPNLGNSTEPVTNHQITLKLVHSQLGDSIETSFNVELPKRLEVNNGQSTLIPETNQNHIFKLKIVDPSVLAFLQNGSAELTSIKVSNTSDLVPSGPTVEFNPTNLQVQLPQEQVTEVPRIQQVQSPGDTLVQLDVQVASNATGGSSPSNLLFFFTLQNSQGEEFVEFQSRSLTTTHQADHTATDSYFITLESAQIDSNTTLKSVTVINQDLNLNESQSFTNSNLSISLNANSVSQKPVITNLAQKAGQPEIAQITFNFPTQDLSGNALPNGTPDVLILAVTQNGTQYPSSDQGAAFRSGTGVSVVSPGVGLVELDFSQFGVPSVTTDVNFVIRTAPPGRAFSAISDPQTASFLVSVASAEQTRSKKKTGLHLNRTRKFYGRTNPFIPYSSGEVSFGLAPIGIGVAAVIGKDLLERLKKAFWGQIHDEIELLGGKEIRYQDFLSIMSAVVEKEESFVSIFEGLNPTEQEELTRELWKLILQKSEVPDDGAYIKHPFVHPPLFLDASL